MKTAQTGDLFTREPPRGDGSAFCAVLEIIITAECQDQGRAQSSVSEIMRCSITLPLKVNANARLLFLSGVGSQAGI